MSCYFYHSLKVVKRVPAITITLKTQQEDASKTVSTEQHSVSSSDVVEQSTSYDACSGLVMESEKTKQEMSATSKRTKKSKSRIST